MSQPNPGSKEAQEQGCTCAIMDNHYGAGVPDGNGGVNFWMSGDCPLHGLPPPRSQYDQSMVATKDMREMDVPEALTAIYEIGLGVIGDPESEDDFPFTPGIKMSARNELRASQRKAWALKCNIKEGEQ